MGEGTGKGEPVYGIAGTYFHNCSVDKFFHPGEEFRNGDGLRYIIIGL
jgi:hypothetical protein